MDADMQDSILNSTKVLPHAYQRSRFISDTSFNRSEYPKTHIEARPMKKIYENELLLSNDIIQIDTCRPINRPVDTQMFPPFQSCYDSDQTREFRSAFDF